MPQIKPSNRTRANPPDLDDQLRELRRTTADLRTVADRLSHNQRTSRRAMIEKIIDRLTLDRSRLLVLRSARRRVVVELCERLFDPNLTHRHLAQWLRKEHGVTIGLRSLDRFAANFRREYAALHDRR